MNRWNYTLNVRDVFHNDALSFEEIRDIIVDRIKAAPFFSEKDYTLSCIVLDLSQARNNAEFDSVWDEWYDYADENRIWVATF